MRSERSRTAVLSVTQLLETISETLTERLGAVAVGGELGTVTRAASGHCYFTLKDIRGGAAIRCVMFRRAVQLSGMEMAEGLAVEVRGRLSIYEPRGEMQLVVEAIRHAGAGALYEEFLRRRARLEAEGLFDAARKRPLPRRPRAIGLVTSLSGAVLHDFCTTMARRAPHVPIVVYPAPVQGAGAAGLLIEALRLAGQRGEVDVVALCRGGGSVEDLWSFNDEALVRAIVASPLPVISGVGHETDVTLCDLAADLRAPTPTAAAELACVARSEDLVMLGGMYQRLSARLLGLLDRHAQQLDRASMRLAKPSSSLSRHRQTLGRQAMRLSWAVKQHLGAEQDRLARSGERLVRAAQRRQGLAQQQLDLLSTRLIAVNPREVLSRGYALVSHLDGDGAPVLSASELSLNESLRLEWADGRAVVTVCDKQHNLTAG